MPKPILCVDTHELAWAAGFFDGEGSVLCSNRASRPELTVSIAQADRRPLDRFHKAVYCIGTVRGPYKPRYENGKPYYMYSASTHLNVQAVVAMIWKWLSEPKKDQAHAAITSAMPYLKTRFIRGSKGRAALSLEEATTLRAEYDAQKVGRVRAHRGARRELISKYGLNSVHTLASIVAGRGYQVNEENK